MAGFVDTLTAAQQVELIYVAYFNRAAEGNGYLFWQQYYANEIASGKTATVAMTDMANLFQPQAETLALYPFLSNTSALSATDPVAVAAVSGLLDTIYSNLFGRTADTDGKAFWSNAILTGSVTLGTAILAIADGATGTDVAILTNKVTVASSFTTQTTQAGLGTSAANTTADLLAEATSILTGVTADTATVTTATTAIGTYITNGGGTAGTTYTLTTGIDNVPGTTGGDTINATDTTLTGLDVINGAGGIDTMNISDVAGDKADIALATISNIEILNVSSTKGLGGTTAGTQDYSGLTGLTALNISLKDVGSNNQVITAPDTAAVNVAIFAISGNSGGNTVDINGGKTVTFSEKVTTGQTAGIVTIKGTAATTTVSGTETGAGTHGAIDVTDVNSTSPTKAGTITTVTLDGIGGASTITDNALATLNLKNTNQVVTVTDNLTAHTTTATTLAVNTTNLSAGAGLTDTNSTIGTLNLTNTSKASSLNITSNTSLKTVTVAGDATVDLSGSTWGALTSLTSTNTAGVTASIGTGVAASFAGGADVLTVGATTKAITMGGGNDTVNLTVAALGTGGSIDAGAGSADVLSMSATNAVTASAGTTFAGTVKGFEVLKLAANAAANPTIDLANLNNASNNSIHTVEFAATNTGSITLANLTSGDLVQFDAAQTAGKTVTASVTGAVTGTSDVLNLKVTNVAAIDVKTIDASNVETVNFLTNDTANDADATIATTHLQHVAALTDAAAKTITVTGDAGLNLTFTGTALTSFDASGVTDGSVTFTTGALANVATIKGGAYNDTLVATTATKAVTIDGGAGDDTITVTNANNNTIVGGAGNDTILVGNGNNTITGGAGNDTITVGTGANTINTGDGNDTVNIGASAGLNTVTFGTGTDTLKLVGIQTAAGYYTTATGLNAGDKIDLSVVIDTSTAVSAQTSLGSAVTLGGAASFANYLDAASAGDGKSVNTILHWFQYAGNTYIVEDTSTAATFQDGHDTVVCLTGLVDLSTATVAAGLITLA